MVRIRGRREDTAPQHRRHAGSTVLLHEYEGTQRNPVEKEIPGIFQEREGLDSILVDEEHTLHCSDFLVRMTEYGPDFSKLLSR